MRRKIPLEKDEHLEVEKNLLLIRDSLRELGMRLARSYPKSNQSVRLSNRAIATLDALHVELGNQRRRDHPEEAPYDGTILIR